MGGIALRTWFKGNHIGTDSFGNKYYEERFFFGRPSDRKPKRWVVYHGLVEASKVPADWHAWLHFTSNETPEQAKPVEYSWMKPHMPNLTGTREAYEPPVNRAATYYQAWQPGHKE